MIIQAVISVVSVLVSGLVGWIFGRRKMLAEAHQTELEAVDKALEIWRKTAEELKCEVAALKNENIRLRAEVNKLRNINTKIIATLEKLTPHNIPEVIDNIKNINNAEL